MEFNVGLAVRSSGEALDRTWQCSDIDGKVTLVCLLEDGKSCNLSCCCGIQYVFCKLPIISLQSPSQLLRAYYI